MFFRTLLRCNGNCKTYFYYSGPVWLGRLFNRFLFRGGLSLYKHNIQFGIFSISRNGRNVHALYVWNTLCFTKIVTNVFYLCFQHRNKQSHWIYRVTPSSWAWGSPASFKAVDTCLFVSRPFLPQIPYFRECSIKYL